MEKYNVFRKSLIIGLMILFVGVSVIPGISGNAEKKIFPRNESPVVEETNIELLEDWIEQKKLTDPDSESNDYFGYFNMR